MIYATVISDIAAYLEQLGNPWKNIQSLDVLVPNLINLVLVVAVVVFFFLLLLGGIRWITAGGDKEALAKAQGKITSALIGIIIVFSAWAILNLVKYFFGLTGVAPPSEPTPTNCLDVCKETSCQGYASFCYKDCRCICNAKGEMWYYENPWCDADTHQYVCRSGVKTPDKNGKVSGTDLNCPGDK